MKYVYFIFLFLILFSFSSINAQSKNDCVIITNLDQYQFMSPALTENNSFVYNNFEFRLYSNINNESYSIEIDNILIANGTIREFIKIINWKCDKNQINYISVNIGLNYYNYSSIWVFSSSLTNGTVIKEDNLIDMTKQEFENYINELRLRLFTSDSVGWFLGLILAQVYVRQYKSTRIEEIE